MAIRKWTEEKIAELEREGRGKGTGSGYKPWVQVTDFSSEGHSRRVKSPKTGRTHHLLSDVEEWLFLLLEFCPAVIDLREQFPLPRGDTLSLATELGIRHPTYPSTKLASVMTCDLLVTLQENGEKKLRAFSCKRAALLCEDKAVNGLEIERSYFKNCDVPHHLVFDLSLPKQKIKNISLCRSAAITSEGTYECSEIYKEHRQRLINDFCGQRKGSLAEFCANYDRNVGVHTGTAMHVVRALVWHREIETDLNVADLACQPAMMFRVASDAHRQILRG